MAMNRLKKSKSLLSDKPRTKISQRDIEEENKKLELKKKYSRHWE